MDFHFSRGGARIGCALPREGLEGFGGLFALAKVRTAGSSAECAGTARGSHGKNSWGWGARRGARPSGAAPPSICGRCPKKKA